MILVVPENIMVTSAVLSRDILWKFFVILNKV